MAITKFERWKTSEKNSDDLAKEADGIFEKPIYEDESPAIQLLHDKVHELTDLINTHITKMAANDAKIGITTSQANAITANTAKTGITTSQSNMITDNMAEAKRLGGLVTTNAANITANAKNIGINNAAAINVGAYPSVPRGVIQSHSSEITFDPLRKKYYLTIYYREEMLAIPPKKGVVTIRTGQIELR